jgi:CPA2 family monovalent cation:H+ antiporter-2
MQEHLHQLVESALLIIGVSIAIVALFQRIHLPSIIGFILTGVLIGPHGLAWIKETEAIKLLAEIGVVLLLFSLGVEFSIDNLLQLRHYVLRAGIAQVVSTVIFCVLGAVFLGYSLPQAFALGMIISLSSTAVGIKLLKQRQESDSTHGRFAIGVLLLQDIVAPLFMAIIPFLSQIQENGIQIVFSKLFFIVFGVIVVYLIARAIFPTILRWITASQTKEIPVLGSILVALLMGYISEKMGLSPALGAFVAGVIISETPYSHQVTANISPFRDSFLALFFISVGMLVNFSYVRENFFQVISWTLGLMIFKCVLVIAIGYAIRRPLRIGLLAGIVLANIGEFSFVLIEQARSLRLLPPDLLDGLVAGTSLSLLLTPLALALIYWTIARISGRTDLLSYYGKIKHKHGNLENHIIIVGFGLNGRNLANLLKQLNEPFIVVEMNGALVEQAKNMGVPVVYGDASHTEIMEAAGIKKARAVVLAISDPVSTRYAVQTARKLNSKVYIIARTRYVVEIERLYKAGATDVIPEEFETFIEIAGRIMRLLKLDNEKRLQIMNDFRKHHYRTFQETEEGVFTN